MECYNIKMDLREVGCDPGEWIDLTEDRDQWRAYVRAVMNLKRKLVSYIPMYCSPFGRRSSDESIFVCTMFIALVVFEIFKV